MSLEGGALLVQTVGRSLAGVGQLGERGELVGMGCIVDVHIDVVLLCHLESTLHLETVTTGHAES